MGVPIVEGIDQAYQYCQKLARSHYENFPVASLVIPKKLQPHIAAVYAFARIADDFADESDYEGVRKARLEEWENSLRHLDEEPSHPVFLALNQTIKRFQIPKVLFEDLLTAFKMDVDISRYESFEQLLNYCRYSANPVGRIVLHLMGYPAPKLMEYSDAICTALQLANFWQDIRVDLEKDRVYLPEEDLKRFHYTEEELFQKVYNENFRRLVVFQVERTQEIFNRGKPLCGKIPGRFGFELRLTWMGGVSILRKILQLKGNVLEVRPVLQKRDFFKIFFGALNKKAFNG